VKNNRTKRKKEKDDEKNVNFDETRFCGCLPFNYVGSIQRTAASFGASSRMSLNSLLRLALVQLPDARLQRLLRAKRARRLRSMFERSFGTVERIILQLVMLCGGFNSKSPHDITFFVFILSMKNLALVSKIFTIIVSAALFNFSTQAQTKLTQATKSDKSANKQKEISDEEKLKETLALSALESLLEDSPNISDVSYRAQIISKSAEILWKHNSKFTKDRVSRNLTRFLQNYEFSLGDKDFSKQDRAELTEAIKTVIKFLARKDARLAAVFQKKFFQIRADYLREKANDRKNLFESLEMAAEGLDVNPDEAVLLAEQILQFGVPSNFPKFLFSLKEKNPALADRLYGKALVFLANSKIYTPNDGVLLLNYAFDDPLLFILKFEPRSEQNPEMNFGFFSNYLIAPDFQSGGDPFAAFAGRRANRELMSSYLRAVNLFLQARFITNTQVLNYEPAYLLASAYLLKKSAAYANARRIGNQSDWTQLETVIFAQARGAGFSETVLGNLTAAAEQSVTRENPFQLKTSDEIFSAAEKSDNPREKMMLRIQAVTRLIDEQKFAEAEKKIAEIEVKEIQENLLTLLRLRAGEKAIEAKDWDEMKLRIKQLESPQHQSYLWLKGAQASATDKSLAEQTFSFLTEAKKTLNAAQSEPIKAKGFVIIAGLLQPLDKFAAQNALTEAKDAINKSKDFDFDEFSIFVPNLVSQAKYGFFLPLQFDDCFKQAARQDWFGTQSIINGIERKDIRALAQIAATNSVL
jgi:hypothetical protein